MISAADALNAPEIMNMNALVPIHYISDVMAIEILTHTL
jgi:hypothetical protein